jgi:hypothetical protein
VNLVGEIARKTIELVENRDGSLLCEPSKFTVVTRSAITIRRMRLLFGGVQPKTETFAAGTDASAPFPGCGMKNDAFEAGCIVFVSAPVRLVFAGRAFPQICQTIVRSISVDMISIFGRPYAMHIQPSQPVGWVDRAIHADQNIPVNGAAATRD